MKKEILPLVNPVNARLPEQLTIVGSDRFVPALMWGSDYPIPENLPEGLFLHWVEPWKDKMAQKKAIKRTMSYDRHENTVALAVKITDRKTSASHSVVVARDHISGNHIVDIYGEPSCVAMLYNEEFLYLLEGQEQ